MEWLDNLLSNKQNKEAAYKQGENATDHFEKKLEANAWVTGLIGIDADVVEKEYNDKLAEEAKLLGKTAAQEFKSDEEVIESDYSRQVKAYSDYNLTELLALARAYKDNVTTEKFSDYKETAKKNVASGRSKCEEELIKLTGSHTLLDWKKAFDTFTKEATPEQPKEKDLYEPKSPEASHEFEKPTEEKFKVPSEEKKADVMIGVGRESNEREDVTKQVGVLQADITEGLGKVASKNKKAEYSGWSNYDTWGLALWLDNEQDLYNQSREMAKNHTDNESLAAELAATYNGLLEEKGETDKSSDKVNWNEIANDLLAESKENAEYERSQGAEGVIDALPTLDVEQEKDKLIDQLATETDPEKKNSLKRKYQQLSMACLRKHLKKQADAMNPLKREELPVQKEGCPVCGSMEGKDLVNGQMDHMACSDCGITYGSSKKAGAHEAWDVFLNGKEIDTVFYTADPKRTAEEVKKSLVNHDGYDNNIVVKKGSQEIKSHASKIETIKKVAEIQSPWIVTKDENGTEVIARRDISELNKVSEEDKTEDLQK